MGEARIRTLFLAIPLVCVMLVVPLIGAILFSRGSETPASSRPAVAVSVEPLRLLVEELTAGTVQVVVAVPTGASPATHVPTDAETARLRGALAYFSVGVPMERGPWFGSIEKSGAYVDLREGLALRSIGAAHDHGEGEHEAHDADPHVWLSPRCLSTMAETIAAALAERLPSAASEIGRRLVALQLELTELDAELAERLDPFRGRAFLVYHPSWGYLADDHGLEQLAIETHGQEPSDAELVELRRVVESHGLRVLFVQPQIHGRSAERLADSLGLRIEALDPLAPDVPANLRRVAEALVRSWSEESP